MEIYSLFSSYHEWKLSVIKNDYQTIIYKQLFATSSE